MIKFPFLRLGGKMKESYLVSKILKFLNEVPQCKAVKRHGSPYGRKGEPDITGSFCGLHFELEVKVPGNKLTPLQKVRLEEWQASGSLVGVVHSLEEVQELFYQYLLNPKK